MQQPQPPLLRENSLYKTHRRQATELLFNPARLEAEHCGIFGVASPAELKSLQSCIVESVNKCDTDLKKDLYGAVIVTGGNTLFPNFKERLERDLSEAVSLLKVKIISPMATTERRFSVWIGGSILASLGSFQQVRACSPLDRSRALLADSARC
jgi:actin-like protein 6A